MGNPNTGDIYEITNIQPLKPGDVPLGPESAARLRDLDIEERKKELQKLYEKYYGEKNA